MRISWFFPVDETEWNGGAAGNGMVQISERCMEKCNPLAIFDQPVLHFNQPGNMLLVPGASCSRFL